MTEKFHDRDNIQKSTQSFARKLHENEYFRRHIAHSTAQSCRETIEKLDF